MNIWIIADNDVIAGKVRDSFLSHGLQCPVSRMISLSSVELQVEMCAEIAGIVLIVVTEVSPSCLETIRRLRRSVDSQTTIALVSSNIGRETILNAFRLGCNDFLNFSLALDKEVNDFLGRIKQGHGKTAVQVHTIIPCQSARDANLLAVNMAAVIAENTGSCGVFDFHFQGGDLALLLKLSPRHSVLDLLHQPEKIDESMFEQVITRHESGIELLAGSLCCSQVGDSQLLECQKLLAIAQASWKDVVISIDSVHSAHQTRILAASDAIILTIRPDIAALHRVQQQIEFLTNHDVKRDRVHIAAMGTGYSGELTHSTVKKLLGVASVHYIPDDEPGVLVSANIGSPLVQELPKSKMSLAIKRFTEETLGYSKQPEDCRKRGSRIKAAALMAFSGLQFCK